MDKFTEYIKSKISGLDNFDLIEAVYNKNTDILSVVFVCLKNLDIIKKQQVESLVKRVIKNISNIEVIIKQVYFDDEIIFKEVKNFICARKGDLLAVNLDKSGCKNNIINLFVDKSVFSEQELFNLTKEINNCLKTKFYKEFDIQYSKMEFKREEVLKQRIQNELGVEDFGAEYNINVHHIVPIIGDFTDENYMSIDQIVDGIEKVAVFGKIENLEKKEFIKKQERDGIEEEVTKNYFSFDLNDGLASVRCVYFGAKDKAVLFEETFKDGNNVCLYADLSQGGKGDLSLRVKQIATCEFEVTKTIKYKPILKNYKYVFPEKYEEISQTSFFTEKPIFNSDYLKNNNFVVFDLETTGLDAQTCKIIEIGAVRVEKGEIVSLFSTFVDPEGHIPDDATAVNNITNEMVKGAPKIHEVLPDFEKFCENAIMVAYNTGFDSGFIKHNAKKQFLKFDNNYDDAMVWAKNKLKGLKNYKLKTVCESLGVSLVGAHRAVNDTIATAKAFIKLIELK